MTLTERLGEIREPKEIKSKAASAAASIGLLLLGAALGAMSKQFDLSGNPFAGVFSDLPVWLLAALVIAVFSFTPVKAAVNVFLFYAGMNAVYHIWSIRFAGFDPGSYMLIWYGLTLISPLLAAFCWYARGRGKAALAADCVILAVLATFCFTFGWVYFGFRTLESALIFAAAAAVMHRTPKQTAITLGASIPPAFLICPLDPVR